MQAEQIGNKVYLDMPEMGIRGYAEVKNIRVNQLDTRFWNENRDGDYVSRPITGKFEHESNDVYYLHFGDNPYPLGVTGSHPIWSIDRNDWVGASELKIGEKVKTHDELTVLHSCIQSAERQRVYNLEVYKDHNFLVSNDQILVHNSCLPKNHLDEGLRRQGFNVGGVYPAGFKQKWTNGGFEYEARIHPADPAYGQTGNIYRVARRRLGTDANGQGDGWEYIDINGNWHHTSTLKPNNPTYNAQAARDTHIPIPNSNIE